MSLCRRIGGVVLGALLLLPAQGQIRNTGSSGQNNGSTDPTVPGSANSTTNPNGAPTISATGPPLPIHVSGRVLAEDGAPPSGQVLIERVCGSSAHAEGYTDSQGYFSVQLGQGAVADASQSGGVHLDGMSSRTGVGSSGGMGRGPGGDNRFANCVIRARLGGYTSQSVELANHGPFDDPNLGIIWIHRIGDDGKAVFVTATTLKAPRKARKALEKGEALAKQSKTAEAITSFRRAVTLYPQFAYAWNRLGLMEERGGHRAEAREAFASATRAEPRWPEPYLRLSLIDADDRNWKLVADDTDHVLGLSAFAYPEAYFLNGVANYNLHRLEAAQKSALAAEKLDTQHQFPQITHLLGSILAELHQYGEAARKLRAYLQIAPGARDAGDVRKLLDQMEKLDAESTSVAGKGSR